MAIRSIAIPEVDGKEVWFIRIVSTILFYEHKTKDITISKDSYDHSATLTYINAGDYSPVYAHDYYERVNDNNSHIVLLNNEQLPLVISDLENMFA